MKHLLWSLLPCLMLASLAGCGPGSPKTTDPSEYGARIDAALQISSPGTKDEALAKASLDAAEAGVGDAVKRGVGAISSPGKKDDAAAACAMKLAKAGRRAEAVEVAKMIGSPGKRDEALKQLASGSE